MEINCCFRKDSPVTRNKFQEGNSFQRKNIPGKERTSLIQKGLFHYKKDIPVKWRKILSREEDFCYLQLKERQFRFRRKIIFRYFCLRREFLVQEQNNWCRKDIFKPFRKFQKEVDPQYRNILSKAFKPYENLPVVVK